MNRNPLVTPEWLVEHLQDSGLVVVDCRFTWPAQTPGKRRIERVIYQGRCILHLEQDYPLPWGLMGDVTGLT